MRPKRAMTLVEMVVTMVLLAIVTISAFSAYAYISTYTVKADNYAAATELLCQTLETLSSYKYSDSMLSIGTSQPEQVNLSHNYVGTRQYIISAETKWDTGWADITFNGYKTITATITWNDGADRNLTLSVRRTK